MLIDCGVFGGKCVCGRSHSIRTKAAVIEPGCMKSTDAWLQNYGITGKRCALYGERTYAATADRHPTAEQKIILPSDGLHADEKATALVLRQLERDIDVILAVGSGTIHDIARFCAHERGIRFVSLPTAASVDGFCSTVSAMTWYGFKKSLPGIAPELVLADLDVIRAAPPELMRSGVGDILAKFTALADWEIAHMVTGEYFCSQIHKIMRDAADAVMESAPELLSGSEQAFTVLTQALILSGLAMQMMGNSRPASGAEHHISHLIEMRPAGLSVRFDALHGEKTGVGSILASRAYYELASPKKPAPRFERRLAPDDDELRGFFGWSLAGTILRENEGDCLAGIDTEHLHALWSDICATVSRIPGPEELEAVLIALSAKHSPEEIGVSQADLNTLLRYSPLVRNRLTLMRLRQNMVL